MTSPFAAGSDATAFARTPAVMEALAALAVVALAALCACVRLWDNDIWWHLATGRWIIQHGRVPTHDVFSYVLRDQPWIDMTWLFQVIVHGLWETAGPGALVGLAMILAAATFGLLLSGLRRPDRSLLGVLVALMAALPLVRLRFIVRPEIFTLFFLAVWLVILERAWRQGRTRQVWWLVPLQVLWVNLHGLFVLGPIMLAAYLVGAALARRRLGLAPVLAASTAACLANPYGLSGAMFPLKLYSRISGQLPTFQEAIGELVPPRQIGLADPAVAWALGLAVAAILSFAPLARRLPWPRLAVLSIFLYLGWQASRNLAMAALIAAGVIALNLTEAVPPSARPIRAWVYAGRALAAGLVTLVCAAGAWAVAAGELYRWTGDNREFGLGLMRRDRVAGVHEFIRQTDPPGNILASNLDLAAAFLFHHFPPRRVFCDGRLEVYDVQYFALFRRFREQLRDGLEDVQAREALTTCDRYGIRHVLAAAVHRKLQRTLAGRPEWRLVYYDPYVCLFSRVDAADSRAFGQRWTLDLDAQGLQPQPIDRWLSAMTAEERQSLASFYLNLEHPLLALRATAATDAGSAGWHWRLRAAAYRRLMVPASGRRAAVLGRLDSADLRVGQVTRCLKKAAALEPQDAALRADLGLFYAETSRLQQAEQTWAGMAGQGLEARGATVREMIRHIIGRELPGLRQRIDQARQGLERWIEVQPEASPTERALKCQEQGLDLMSESLLRARLAAEPADGTARALLVQTCLRNGEAEAARALLSSTPSGAIPPGYLGLLMADVLRLEGRESHAAEALQQIATDPEVAQVVRVKLAEIALEQGRGQQALAMLDEAWAMKDGLGRPDLRPVIEAQLDRLRRAMAATATQAQRIGWTFQQPNDP